MFGTQTTFDDLAAANVPIPDIGYNNAYDAIESLFTSQNAQVQEQLSNLVEYTTDAVRNAASTDTTTSQELDEHGTPNPQKPSVGAQLGFPLRKFGQAWQATDDALEAMTGMELAAQATATATADLRRVQERIRLAFYTPTNYDFIDRLVPRNQRFTLKVKALANADSFPIPPDPNGNAIDSSTHNHYLATVGASPAQSDYDRLIDHVKEHVNSGTVVLAINSAQEATVRAFTGFYATMDPRVVVANSISYAMGAYDPMNSFNTKIGVYRGAEVWVKPWVLTGYPVAWVDAMDKPLVLREKATGARGLRLKWESYMHPLTARVWIHEFDVAVWNRVAAAVLDTTHQTTYVLPTIPAA